MRNAHMGLESVIRSITSPQLTHEIFTRFAPSVRVEWTLPRKQLVPELVAATGQLAATHNAERQSLLSNLQDVCAVSADRRTPERLIALVGASRHSRHFTRFMAGEDGTLQNGVCWLLLHDAESWNRLLAAARAHEIKAHQTDEFTVAPCREPNLSRKDQFTDAVRSLISSVLHQGMFAHLEPVFDGEAWLYFLSVNKYPTNVQHFDEKGTYSISWDRTADNFLLEYQPKCGVLRVKCDFVSRIRQGIAASFAEIMVGGKASPRGRQSFDLTFLLHEPTSAAPLTKAVGHGLVDARLSALSVAYTTEDGNEETITRETTGNTDLRQKVLDVLEHENIDTERARVVFVAYVLSIAGTNGAVQKYRARIDKKGFHYRCLDRTAREIIHGYLAGVVS